MVRDSPMLCLWDMRSLRPAWARKQAVLDFSFHPILSANKWPSASTLTSRAIHKIAASSFPRPSFSIPGVHRQNEKS